MATDLNRLGSLAVGANCLAPPRPQLCMSCRSIAILSKQFSVVQSIEYLVPSALETEPRLRMKYFAEENSSFREI